VIFSGVDSTKVKNCSLAPKADFGSVTFLQAEPYLHSGMGQVSFCQEALKIFFSRGVDLNRYNDT